MPTMQIMPARRANQRRLPADDDYWQWRRRSIRRRLIASGLASWLLHGLLALVLLWGGESLVTRRGEPPRVDVVAAVGETMGAPSLGDDGIAPSSGPAATPLPTIDSPSAASQGIPEFVPSAVAESLPQVRELSLPGAEIIGPIIGSDGGLLGGAPGTAEGQGGRGGGGSGPAGLGTGFTNTEFIGVEGAGSRFVYVIDRSGSMSQHDRLGAVKREILASLAKLNSETQFQIIFYNLRPDIMPVGGRSQRLVFATDANRNQATRYLEGVIADGGTEHVPALKLALSLGPDVVFFLTDADDLKIHEVKEVTDVNRGRATIHAIEFAVGPAQDQENMLQKLAEWNSGTYRYIDVGKLKRELRR